MSEEQDSMADIIQTFKITPEEIVEKTIPSSELYELKIGSQELSPFWVETLKKQIESGSPLFTPDIKIRNLGTEEWFDLFHHPVFQRREEAPQHGPSTTTEESNEKTDQEDPEEEGEFFILAKGQKVGPITLNTLREKVGTKEILVTDLISHDEGETWSKIFEMPEFDRRAMGQRDHLPHLPQDNIFKGSKTEVMDNLKNGDKESDTIFNLVHLGRKKGEEEAPIPSTPIAEKDEGEEFFSEKTISVVLIIISLIGIGYFANLNFSTPKKRISKRSRSAKKEVATQRAAQRKRPERPKKADAPPPPPDRGQESSPQRPSRDNKSISTIKRDRPPRLPDNSSRRMQDRPLIEERNYSNDNRDDGYGDQRRDDRRDQNREGNTLDGVSSNSVQNNRDRRADDSMDQNPPNDDQGGFNDDPGRDIASQQIDDQGDPYQDQNMDMDPGMGDPGMNDPGMGDPGMDDIAGGENYDEPPMEQDIY